MKTLRFAIIFSTLIGMSFSSALQAGQYDLKEMTPEVTQALKNRQARYGELQDLKTQNSVGENSDGYVTALGDGSASGIAAAENRDREVIYRAIADQNQLGPTGLKVIETVFAEVQREKTRAGESFQLSSGEWTKKS
ncbi:MAG: DUF1318 domain-containing protein [Candidatus Omnitrophota bacterium]|nr:DUF1318 domain-containing protein [Candidatus Omnitrophota bacterium]